MSPATEPDLIDFMLFAAPIAGALANLCAQLTLPRFGWGLVASIIGAFVLGALMTSMIAALALLHGSFGSLEALFVVAMIFTVYGAAAFVLFAIANLGETSLRVRMMQMLLDRPEEVTTASILERYDDAKLLSVRLQRMVDNHQVVLADGIYYPRHSPLLLAAGIIRLLKWLLYGHARALVSVPRAKSSPQA